MMNNAMTTARWSVRTASPAVKLFSFPWFWVAAAAALFCANTAHGADIIRVEEDWVVEVSEPETDKTAPQIYTVISPYGNISNLHAIFELNHKTQPDYSAGGMQLQSWNGTTLLDYRNNGVKGKLSHSNETISFTVRMEIVNGVLQFEIRNGSSTTWGTFGGQGYLKTSIDTAPNDLNDYDPTLSIKESKVGYSSHRVKKLARTAVRYYSSEGLVVEDKTEKVVHEHTTSD